VEQNIYFAFFCAFSCTVSYFIFQRLGIWFDSAYQDLYEIIAVCPYGPLNLH